MEKGKSQWILQKYKGCLFNDSILGGVFLFAFLAILKVMTTKYTYIYNRILLSHKKEQNNAICNNMDTTGDSCTKRSKSERERQTPYGITYMWNLKYGTNEPTYRTEIDLKT